MTVYEQTLQKEMCMQVSLTDFLDEPQGKTFKDVVSDTRINFQIVLDFFNRQDIQTRLEGSELHHDRPPLAGVVREFEFIPDVDAFFCNHDSHTTKRFRQAVGALTRMHMERLGWSKTGRKGSLGTRGKVPPGTTTPGAYQNTSGLSKWFTCAERYEPSQSHTQFQVWQRAS